MDSRFATRNFGGVSRRYFFVEALACGSTDTVDTDTNPSHHIVVLDASGSMYRDMASMKATVRKLWTLEEFQNSNQLVSLLSYSSEGDLRTHFSRVRVADVMAADSSYLKEIDNLRVRGLTCMSQALEGARQLCQTGELTCITLHSDGYANHRSPTQERRTIDRIIGDFAGMQDVYVNTIAHRAWSDFGLLNSISNSLSGKCVQAGDIRAVFDALHDTTTLLSGQRTPAIAQQIGNADYQVFVSVDDGRVNGTDGDLQVTGLSNDGDKTIYRYRSVTEAEYNSSSLPECGEGNDDLTPVYAYSRAMLAEGSLNTAKYALVSTRNGTLLDEYSRALTNEEIAAFSNGLENVLFNDPDHTFSDGYGVDTSVAPVLSILGVLDTWSRALRLDTKALSAGYKRRGLKRVAGKRLDDGSLELPWIDSVETDTDDFAQVGAVEVNRNTATANIRVERSMQIVERESGNAILDISGVDVSDLKSYRNYTLVGDGSLNVSEIVVQISDKRAFRELVALGVLTGDYNPTASYTISLAGRPLVAFDQTYASIDGVFDTLAQYKALGSILTALTATTSEALTGEQVTELKRHYLSPALYLSLPTTYEYTELDDAMADGSVDTRLSYKVDIGNTDIVSTGKLKSANAYLVRRFTVALDNVMQKKGTWAMWWDDNYSVGLKKLTARTKLDATDDILMPIFEGFLGFGNSAAVTDILVAAGADAALVASIEASLVKTNEPEEQVEAFNAAKRCVKAAEKALFADRVSPVAFYIGATGLVPDEFDAPAMTADDLAGSFPNIKLSKGEKEGTFFQVGSSLISVFIKEERFSTGNQATA